MHLVKTITWRSDLHYSKRREVRIPKDYFMYYINLKPSFCQDSIIIEISYVVQFLKRKQKKKSNSTVWLSLHSWGVWTTEVCARSSFAICDSRKLQSGFKCWVDSFFKSVSWYILGRRHFWSCKASTQYSQ